MDFSQETNADFGAPLPHMNNFLDFLKVSGDFGIKWAVQFNLTLCFDVMKLGGQFNLVPCFDVMMLGGQFNLTPVLM